MILSPSHTAFEGFRIIRDRPGLILAWSGFYLLSLVLMILILLLPNLGGLAAAEIGGGERGFDQLLARYGAPILIVFPLAMVMITMLVTAVYRAVLRPDDSRFAYLRLGGDEFRVFGVSLIVLLFFTLVSAVYGLGIVYLTNIAGPFHELVTFVGSFGALALIVWLAVKMSLAGVMTFAERGVRLRAAWRLADGHFWRLLATVALTAVFALIVVTLSFSLSFVLAKLLGGFSLLGELEHPRLGKITPGFALALLGQLLLQLTIQTLLIVLVLVIFYGPPAAAYRTLKAPSPEAG